MELGKYKKALRSMTRSSGGLRTVVYDPNINDTDADFPNIEEPRLAFAGGGEALKANELVSYLRENGINVNEKNLGRFIKDYGIKKGTKMVEYVDTKTVGGKTYTYKRPPVKLTSGIYKKPTEKQLEQIKTRFDKNQLKATGSTEIGREAFLERKQRITDLLLEGKTRKEVAQILKKETGIGVSNTITEVVKELKDEGFDVTPTRVASNTPASVYAKERRKLQKATSDPYIENKIKNVKSEAGLGKIDLAHRASMKQNKRLGTQISSSSLGVDDPRTNRKFVKPYENFLEDLYKKQARIANKLRNNGKDLSTMQDLERVNKQISELVDRTDGLLNGILIDEYDLSVKSYGADPSVEFGAGLIDNKKVSDLSSYDIDLGVKQLPGQKKAIAEKLKNISKQDATNIISSIACPATYSDGGRVNFKQGSNCFTKGLEIIKDAKRGNPSALGKVKTFMKGPGRYALPIAGELAAEALFVVPSIAEGKPWSQVLNETTFGLVGLGTTEDEQIVKHATDKEAAQQYLDKIENYNNLKRDLGFVESVEQGGQLGEDFFTVESLRPRIKEQKEQLNKDQSDPDLGRQEKAFAEGEKNLETANKERAANPGVVRKGFQLINDYIFEPIGKAAVKTYDVITEPSEADWDTVFDEVSGYAEGGRVGLEDGGDPKDKLPNKSRRKFLKGVGWVTTATIAIASGLVRLGKKEAAKQVLKRDAAKFVDGKGVPNYIKELLYTADNFGNKITTPGGYTGVEHYNVASRVKHNFKGQDIDLNVEQLTTGEVNISWIDPETGLENAVIFKPGTKRYVADPDVSVNMQTGEPTGSLGGFEYSSPEVEFGKTKFDRIGKKDFEIVSGDIDSDDPILQSIIKKYDEQYNAKSPSNQVKSDGYIMYQDLEPDIPDYDF